MRTRLKYVAIQVASARGVADRWASGYQHPVDGWRSAALACGKTPKEIHSQLVALGANPPLDKVAEVIGNKSWSYITCDGCGDSVERAASIGEYEPKTYCETCLDEASQALKATAGQP